MMTGSNDNLALGYTLGRDANGGANGGMGAWGAESWWFIIVLFALWGGFGGNGWGGGGGAGTQGAITRSDLSSEFAFNDLQNAVRGISDRVNTGFQTLDTRVCQQSYENAQMINGVTGAVTGGFAALNNALCQQQYETTNILNNMNIANMQNANAANVVAMQNANAIQGQLASCCCDQKAALADLKYTIASEDCATRNLIQNSIRDQMENCNANTRAILQTLNAQEMARKDEIIAAQNQRLFAADLAASQAQQNNYLINTLRPFPVAAYQVCNPFTGTFGYQGYGNANYGGCGCGC